MISIVIATYNEADNIEFLLDQLRDYKVIVVDDNSPDGTAKIARQFKNVQVIVPPTRLGIAKSYKLGFIEALKHNPEYVIQMDAGLTHNPKDIKGMIDLARLGNYNLVYGSRFSSNFEFKGYRSVISVYAMFLMNLIGVRVSDASCGFRCWNPAVLGYVISPTWLSKGFAFQLETLFLCSQVLGEIKDYPIEYKLTNSSFNYKMLLEAIKIYLKLLTHV